MSLKRYAIIAAVSYHNNHQNNNQNSSTNATGALATSSQYQRWQNLSSAIATARAALNNTTPSNNTNNGGNAITPYTGGGLGLFHQQNIRANSAGNSGPGGVGLLNGVGGNNYSHAINGNVNLLLGGAMLSLVTTILCVVCYCCHRNIKKRTEAAYRQQHQWLENDPNMEIYSVEQCYETSGLFLGESSDGLSTYPTLHHEPPPSYDSVVAMQEQQLLQQQQQQHLLLLHHQQQQQMQIQMQIQRNSPPPGYRSSLDVSGIASTSILSCNRGAPDGMDTTSDGNGNLSNTTSSGNIYVQRKQFTNNNNNDNKVSVNTGGNAILNIKKGFTAQSCCSLQRAEVENMWHAAAAAVVARAAHATATTSPSTSNTNATNEQAMAVTTPTILRARKSLPSAYGGAKLSVNEISRRYLQPHNYYQRGCPLCGKFCYEVDDTFSLSTESGLDNPTTCGSIAVRDVEHLKRNGNNAVGDNNCTACAILQNANNNYNNDFLTKFENGEATTEQIHAGTALLPSNLSNEIFIKPEQSILANIPSTTALATIATVTNIATNNEQTTATVDLNGNNNNENDSTTANKNTNSNEIQNEFSLINTDLDTNANAILEPAIVPAATTQPTTTLNTETPTTAENVRTDNLELNLDSINENGIVRLDMSKIIDKTGLPTYEAALKLESSGYV